MPFDFSNIYLANAASGTDMLLQFLPLIALFALLYFILIRPSQQKAKQHRALVEGLRRGDEVVTQGGLIGKITRVNDGEVTVELADGVRVKMIRNTIIEVRARTEPSDD